MLIRKYEKDSKSSRAGFSQNEAVQPEEPEERIGSRLYFRDRIGSSGARVLAEPFKFSGI
jgi:hypothetical protein